jgi:hypothetical protein
MKKIKFVFFIFSFFILSNSSFSLNTSNIQQIIKIYFQQLNRNINLEELKSDLNKLEGEKQLSKGLAINIVNAIRNQGVLVSAYRVDKGDFLKLNSVDEPIILFLENKGLFLIRSISSNLITYIDSQGKTTKQDLAKFFNSWEGCFISQPLVDFEMELYPSKGKNDFYIIYSYHKEKFEEAKPILDRLIKLSKKENKKLIYIDELGLIPKQTIENRMKWAKISEREAFEKVRKEILKEDDSIEKGIPVYEPNYPFYNELYKYLAKYKIKSIMENLQYENWKQIVQFDDLKLDQEAIKYFSLGKVSQAVDTMYKYLTGFWLHNVNNREKNFSNQILKLKETYPDSIIFTIRGIGHYGIGEKLHLLGMGVREVILGKGNFCDNFVSGQYLEVLKTNNVKLQESEEKNLILKNFTQEYLRIYFNKKFNDLTKATIVSKKIVDKIKMQDLILISFLIKRGFIKGKLKTADDVYNFVYNWVKKKGYIKEPVK